MEIVRMRQNKLVAETRRGVFEAEGILQEAAVTAMAESTMAGAAGFSV
jgi:hypothetical protein